MRNLYTLNKKYVLKKNSDFSYELFNTYNSKKYQIKKELYLILSYFKYNCMDKDKFFDFLKSKNIPVSQIEFERYLNNSGLVDVLEEAGIPYAKYNEEAEYPSHKFPFFVQNTPSRADLIITEKCNLVCKHCFQDSSPLKSADFASFDRLKILFDELEELNILTLKISGGEPLLHPEIQKIMEYLAHKKYKKSILTNALLFTDQLIRTIKGTNIHFGISLDGAQKKSHEFLRGKHTFERTCNNLLKLKEARIPFSITTTLHPYNYIELDEICKFVFNKLEVKTLNLNFLLPLGRGSVNSNIALSPIQIQQVKENVSKLSIHYPEKTINCGDLAQLSFNETEKDIIYCSAGTKILAINPSLEIYPCTYAFGMEQFKMGTIGEDKLINIWLKEDWNIFRGDTRLSDLPTCSGCKLNKICDNVNCRLIPITQGLDFYSPVTYCAHG